MKKRNITLALALLLTLVLTGGGIAYYVTSGVAQSAVTTSNVKIETQTVDSPMTIAPGKSVDYEAAIKNVGKEPCWVRAKLSVTDPEETTTVEESHLLTLAGVSEEEWILNQDDGYWYYQQILEPGETTAPLFTGVTFASNIGKWYEGKNITLKVDGQATQSKYNGEKVDEATGWPAE